MVMKTKKSCHVNIKFERFNAKVTQKAEEKAEKIIV